MTGGRGHPIGGPSSPLTWSQVRVPYAPSVPDAEVSLPGEARSVPEARSFVRKILVSWNLRGAEPAASVVVSELAANAVLHARSEVTIRVSRVPGGVRVEVHDSSPRLPTSRRYARDATTGRGLGLVAALARDWGVETTESGKTVWCEIDQAESASGFPAADMSAEFDVDRFVDPFETDAGIAAAPGTSTDTPRNQLRDVRAAA